MSSPRALRTTAWLALAFAAQLTFVLAASAPAQSAGFAPGDVRVTTPSPAAGSAIAIDPVLPASIVAGTLGPTQQVRMQRSTDGGQSWAQSELPLGNTCRNPAVAWSSDGRFAYATALAYCVGTACELEFYRSSDGGATWNDLERDTPGSPRRALSRAASRGFLHVDLSPVSPFRDRVYVPYDDAGTLHVARSTDFGNRWSTATFAGTPDEQGTGADLVTNRRGDVVVAWAAMNSRTIRVRTSTDGGNTFGASVVVASTRAAYRFPVPAQDLHQVWLAVSAGADVSGSAHAGSVYLAWTDATAPTSATDPAANHARVQVAVSRDGGATWSVSTPHATGDVLDVDRFNPALAVGADGTVHVVYYDSRNSADRSGVDVYYAFSTDGTLTWSTPRRVTAVTSPHVTNELQLGDYNGLDVVLDDLIASFTDNRSETGAPGDSADVYASGIASGGTSPAAGRVPGSEGVAGAPLTVTRNADGLHLDLHWSGACGAATDYAVYEGRLGDPASKVPLTCSTGGATAASILPSAAQRFYLVVATVPGAEGSYGSTSGSGERPPSRVPCLPQRLGACP